MKIRALQCIAGHDFVINAGEETDRFDAAEAARFVEAGFAVPVAAKPIERAVAAAPHETRKRKPKEG